MNKQITKQLLKPTRTEKYIQVIPGVYLSEEDYKADQEYNEWKADQL